MFDIYKLNLKWKSLLFCICSIPLLILLLLLNYAPLIIIDFWLFNDIYFSAWLYIILLIFVVFPLLVITVSEGFSISEKVLLDFAFLFLVFDLIQYGYAGIDLDQVLITIILATILNFSFHLRDNSSELTLSKSEWAFNIILIILILIFFFRPPMLEYLTNIYYVYQAIAYILIICFILVYLFKNRENENIE